MLRIKKQGVAAWLVIAIVQGGLIVEAGEVKEQVQQVVDQARKLSETIQVPENIHTEEGLEAARQTTEQYNSPAFQENLRSQMERIQQSKPDQQQTRRVAEAKGILTGQESVFVFLSSSMPESMVNRHLIDIDRTGEQRLVPVMFGLPQGIENKRLNASYFYRVMRADPGCRDTHEVRCTRLAVPLQINPTLFGKYDISEVPALVYDNGQDSWSVQGEMELAYLLEKVGKAANRPTLTSISTRLRGGQ